MPVTQEDVQTLEKLLARPKARRKLLEIVKEEFPEAQIPEIDAAREIESRIQGQIGPLQETIAELKQKLSEKEKANDWQRQLDDLKTTFGWDDKKVDEFTKSLATEFKDRTALDLVELAEYQELKNRPMAPQGQPAGAQFFSPRGDAEARWRADIRDPKSKLFSKNKREKKAYLNELWQAAKGELAASQGRTR